MSNEHRGFDSFHEFARTRFEAHKSALKTRRAQTADDDQAAVANVVAYVDDDGGGHMLAWISFVDDATATFTGTFTPATPFPSAVWTICAGDFPTDEPSGTATWQATCSGGTLTLVFQLASGTTAIFTGIQPGWCFEQGGSGSFDD